MHCKYFGQCGGCFHSQEYEKQTGEKQALAERVLGQAVPIEPSPQALGYRNRMDFVCAFGRTGLRPRGSHKQVVDIDHCPLMSDRMNRSYSRARQLVQEAGLPDYDYLKHQGYLRYIVVREGKRTGEVMVSLVTASPDDRVRPVLDRLSQENNAVAWLVNDSLRESSFGEVKETLNQDHIRERLGDISFRIAPNTFFQSNTFTTEKIYKDIKHFVPGGCGLDLYCGVGSITLFIADACRNILGVENVSESIVLAEQNAADNRISNVKFVHAEARPFLHTYTDTPDFVVVDPPRAGLGKRVCRKLLKLEPPRIIMMSCNPKTLHDDLAWLKDRYGITRLKAYDMFPYTAHVEMLAVLDRL